jgi:hydrogenase/urease accessory protein HupE
MRRSIRHAASLAALVIANAIFSTAAFAHPGHSHEGLAGFAHSLSGLDPLLAMVAGALSAWLTVWVLLRRFPERSAT